MDGKPRKRNMRRRAAEQEDEGEQDPAAAIAAATVAAAKRSKAAKGGSTFATRRDEDDSKLRTFNFESSNALQQHSDMGATAVLETETQHDRDARALREQRMRQAAAAQAAQGVPAEGEGPAQPPPDDGLYKGLNSYTDFRAGFRREQTVAGEKGKGHGPLRASVHMRQTAIFDYKPDICKDYKETGYCGYGDSCKFIHDRSDYKSGWELDREWEQEQKLKRQRELQKLDPDASGSESDSEDDDGLPFACFICRRPWADIKDPVVTRCKHYFCESCALKHNAKTSKCFVCEQPTGGIFNVATEIEKKVKLQKQQDISNRWRHLRA